MSTNAAHGTDGDDEWTAEVSRLLGSVTRERTPALEYVLIDCLATWLFSDANPGASYDQDSAAQIVSVLFTALSHAHDVEPAEGPREDSSISASRDALVAGAHQLSEGRGVTTLITRAMPAMVGELEKYAGDPARQLFSAYFYLLFAVATGTGEEGDPKVPEGLSTSFMAWDGLFASGAVSRLAP